MKRIIILTLMFVSIVAVPAFARDKTDVVTLANGDRVTGEIRHLEHGILRLSTDSMSDINIEWDDVLRIESNYEFQFERTDGTRIAGTIVPTVDQHEILVSGDHQTAAFAHEKIIRISQLEDSFFDRVNGSANFGFNFTKASDVSQLSFGLHANHRTEIREFSIDTNIIRTSDRDGLTTQQSDLQLGLTKFRNNRRFNSFLLGFESNDELGLKLRSSFGGGFGRYLIQTNTSELSVIAGVLGTSESFTTPLTETGLDETSSHEQNIEGLLGVEFSKFIFDDPKVDMSFKLSVFPSITDSGRYRAQFDANIRRELIEDLFLNLNLYDSYDNDPPSSAAESTNDYGIVTSLGWSF